MNRIDIGSFRNSIRCSYTDRFAEWTGQSDTFTPVSTTLFLVKEGRMAFTLENQSFRAGPGDLLCLAPGGRIGLRRNHFWKGYHLHYRMWGKSRSPEWVDLPPVFPQVSLEIQNWMHALHLECLDEDVFARRRARAYLELILTTLAGHTQIESPIRLLEHIIRDNLQQNIPLDEAAKRCAMSPSTLKRTLKDLRGETFSQFKHGIKIAIAQQTFAADPKIRLAEVADLFGYHDAFHFSRTFKHLTGMSPKAYRQSLRVT